MSFLLRITWWTISPWVQFVPHLKSDVSVIVEPVGFIESGKLQSLQGAPAARALSHRLQRINSALRRDMTKEYAIVQDTLNVSLPEASAPASTTFDPVISEPVTFEAKLFNLDVVGIGTFFYRQLYRGDTLRVLVEVKDPKSRYFIEVQRPGRPADQRAFHVDRTVGGDLHDVLRNVACDTAFIYHGAAPHFVGMTEEVFCEFLDALNVYQDFVIQTAAAAEHGDPVSPAGLERAIAAFQSPSMTASPAPIVHILRASLYKLQGNVETAVATLEKAQALSPGERFVIDNLPKWRRELEERIAARAEPPIEPARPDAALLARAYAEILAQPALRQIDYAGLLARAAGSAAQPLTVSVLSTGYTPGAAPLQGAEILPVESLVAGEEGLDRNGHGTTVVNLLAALIPYREVKILPIKVLSDSGSGVMSDIIRGFERSVSMGARLIVVPLGGGAPSKILEDIIKATESAGIMTIAAAGNTARRPDDAGSVSFPGSAESVVAVGASDPDGGFAAFSPGPENVEVFVPGIDIATVDAQGRIVKFSGTSFSVTLAVAAVATALAPRPARTNAEIRDALTASSAAIAENGPAVLNAERLWQELSAKGS